MRSNMTSSPQPPSPKIFDIPLDTNKNYVERKGLSKQLNDLLQPTIKPHSNSRRAALYGLGGSGKTEPATRFAEMHRDHYSATFWVNATDFSHLIGGFSRITRLLGIGNGASSEISMDLAQDWLTTHSEWLRVI